MVERTHWVTCAGQRSRLRRQWAAWGSGAGGTRRRPGGPRPQRRDGAHPRRGGPARRGQRRGDGVAARPGRARHEPVLERTGAAPSHRRERPGGPGHRRLLAPVVLGPGHRRPGDGGIPRSPRHAAGPRAPGVAGRLGGHRHGHGLGGPRIGARDRGRDGGGRRRGGAGRGEAGAGGPRRPGAGPSRALPGVLGTGVGRPRRHRRAGAGRRLPARPPGLRPGHRPWWGRGSGWDRSAPGGCWVDPGPAPPVGPGVEHVVGAVPRRDSTASSTAGRRLVPCPGSPRRHGPVDAARRRRRGAVARPRGLLRARWGLGPRYGPVAGPARRPGDGGAHRRVRLVGRGRRARATPAAARCRATPRPPTRCRTSWSRP